MLSITVGITETMTVVAAKLQRLVEYSCCVLFLHDEEQLACRFVSGVNAELINNDPFLFEEQAKLWLTHLQPSTVEINPKVNIRINATFQSTLVISLVFQERLLGVLVLYHKQQNAYTTEHQSVIESVSPQISAIVANSMIFNQTQYDSLSDPLTGLPNRRAFTQHLKDELNSAKRTQSQLALFVIDLDQFKQINDHYGHLVGDQALCSFGHMLGSIVAPSHFCARYAGDEFILILSECNNETVQRVYKELIVGLETLTIETKLDSGIKLKASIGIAIFPTDGKTHEQLFTTADDRMYQNKTRISTHNKQYSLRSEGNIKSKGSTQTHH
tara:strand:- start:64 stop:1050 length:987 start_codon:yes stop_codon:yes gene_type:complete